MINDQEKETAILRKRAQLLAREPAPEEDPQGFMNILEFILANERYALEISYITEILKLKELSALPSAPPFVLGIINVRGEILSIIDLKTFFNLPAKGLSNFARVIRIRYEAVEFGILADVVNHISSIPISDIQPCPPTLSDGKSEYLKGVGKNHLIILDGQKILTDKKLVINDQ